MTMITKFWSENMGIVSSKLSENKGNGRKQQAMSNWYNGKTGDFYKVMTNNDLQLTKMC